MNSGCSNPSHEMEHARAKCFAFIFLSLTLSFQKKMDNFGAPDTILFALVIVSTAGAGVFQGWFEAYTQDEPQRHGLALPKGKGPFGDFLYLLVLTCSVPLILGT